MAKSKKEMLEQEQEKEYCKQKLLEILEENQTIYTVLIHCSQNGMFRVIKLLVGGTDKTILDISYYAGILLYGYDKRGGCKASGCGMDMGFNLVYSLSQKLFGNGYKLKHQWL